MSKYKIANLEFHTSESDKNKLIAVLKAIHGVTKVLLIPSRHEFTLDYVGRQPNFYVIRGACESIGFQVQRKL